MIQLLSILLLTLSLSTWAGPAKKNQPRRLLKWGAQIMDANPHAFLYTNGKTVWHYSFKRGVRKVTQETGASEWARLSPDGNWVAIASEDRKKQEFQVKLIQPRTRKEVKRPIRFSSLSLLAWRDDCTVIAASEKHPKKFYTYRVPGKCKSETKDLPILYSSSNQGAWLITQSLKKAKELDWKRNFYGVRRSALAFTGAYSDGGVFAYLLEKDVRFSHSKGFRPSINELATVVAFQTPKNEIFLWDLQTQKAEKWIDGKTPMFVKGNEILYSTKQGVFLTDWTIKK